MDVFSYTKASLPEPSVSEEGTFCDSFNDTISRLEQEYERANILLGSGGPSPAKSGANWDQKSEFVDPLCDVLSMMSKSTAPLTQLPEKGVYDGPNDAVVEDTFAYNKHNESIFDDFRYFPSLRTEQSLVVKFDEKDPECISYATLRALLVQLTSPEVIDYNLICDFFLTYRTFTDAHVVLNLLITRLIWSLQYINSQKADTEKLGKLVLLRTFVVLRHWILNYFYDDFELDEKLCDLFTFHINEICAELALLAPHMAFELKIFRDLKTHWLLQINEFFGRHFTSDNTASSLLPMLAEYFDVKRLTKSNTEASIHTNPSFRRSAMLSLYDQKTHHKCIVYDDAIQLPIGNLVNQHKSSRMSLDDKLKEYCTKGAKQNNLKFTLASRREPLAPKHNYLNLTDSSLALKKTSHVPEKPETKHTDLIQPGFSTNGRIKLPSSRITKIVPLSPVKKMRCSLKDDLKSPIVPYETEPVGRKRSIKRVVEGWTKSLYSPDMRSDRSTFSQEHAADDNEDKISTDECEQVPSNKLKHKEIGDRVDVLSARIVDELEFVIRYYIYDARPTISEQEAHDDISRATIAFSPKKKVTDILFPTAALEREKSRVSNATKDMSIQDISELNIEKIDNLFSQTSIGEHSDALGDSFNSLGRKSHAYTAAMKRASRVGGGSKRSSFAGRVASINWNDDGNLFLENSTLLCDSSARPETKFYDVSDEQKPLVKAALAKAQLETQSSDLDFSDVEQYDAEVSELGIAMSPQSLKRKHVQKITLQERLGPSVLAKGLLNLSRNSTDSLNKHESLKSYMTYDSEFSAMSESSRNEQYTSHLKKKHGYQDLRKLAEDGDLHHLIFARLSTSSNVSGNTHIINRSMASHLSRTSSLAKKSTRLSTLCALTELPFNLVRDSYASASTRALFQDESGKMSDLSISSVFSSAATREQNPATDSKDDVNVISSASVAIPGISNNILRELASIPDESFSSKNPVQHALFKLEGKSGSSSHIDESVPELETPNGEKMSAFLFEKSGLIDGKIIQKPQSESNPELVDLEQKEEEEGNRRSSVPEYSVSKSVRYAEDVQTSPQQKPLQVPTEPNDLFQNTEDILDEINNAVTEDAIGYSSDIENELKNRPITPIKTRSKSTLLMSQSNSIANARYSVLPTSESGSPYSLLNPKLVLDGYYLASEHLSVKQVMLTGSHVSFILSYDSKAIAEHFTIIERDMLQEIDWKELIELKWNKELTPVNSWLEIIVNDEYYNKNKGVNLVIARFNLVVNWIISEILLTKDGDERREIVSRFIHIAYHSYEMQNFSTLMQIVLALTSEKVNKLKSTWNNLSPGDILTLKHLEQMSSPLKNFINMRVSTNQIKPSKGCIPFVGLYLSDLIFNAERPKFAKTKPVANPLTNEDSSETSVTQSDSTMTSNPGVEAEKMINFSRFRTSVHIVKSLSQSIEWSQNYNVTVDDELLRRCLYIKSLDENEMNFCLEQLDT